MTAAERQRRHRAKKKRQRSEEVKRKERRRRRDKAARKYIPMPPGVTYWRKVRVQTDEGEQEILAPLTKPIPECCTDMGDDEIQQLLRQLLREAHRRGLEVPEISERDETAESLAQAEDVTPPSSETEHDSVTIGPKP